MNKALSYVFIVLSVVNSIAQNTIKGQVLDANNNPLAYVSIGIPGSNIGSYSFEDGSFKLILKNLNQIDSVQFSHIGYRTKFIPIGQLINDKQIIINLRAKAEQLDEVIIGNNRNNSLTLGIVKKNSSSDINMNKPYNGSEVAILIEGEKFPYAIEKINLNVVSKNLQNYTIRVKIYDIDKRTNQPKSNISTKDITGAFNVKRGKVGFNLEDPIKITESVFLSFEWLVSKENAIKIKIANQIKSEQILTKYTSSFCDVCSRVIENNKRVNFFDSRGKSLDIIKLKKEDKNLIKEINIKLPRLAFQTTKSNYTTYYRYASFGKWYEYSQSLIASINGY